MQASHEEVAPVAKIDDIELGKMMEENHESKKSSI